MIRYIDNLAMLVKNTQNRFNDDVVKKTLVQVCDLQSKYIVDKNILDIENMNILINFINDRYNLEIPNIVATNNNNNALLFDKLFLDEVNKVDIEYLKRFF